MKIVASLDEVDMVVAYLEANISENTIVFLRGDLAAGKTTLVQAVAMARGIEGEATSPTFSLQHYYGNGLYHYDLYRIDDQEFMNMGIFESFEENGWHLIEWGSKSIENLLRDAGYNVAVVNIEQYDDKRKYEIVI